MSAVRLVRLLSPQNCIHPASVFVRLGSRCNQHCGFCNIRGREAFELTEGQALDELRGALRSRSEPVIHFTGGEPTLRADLVHLVAAARDGGARAVILQTNGLRLAAPRYLERLVQSGVTGLILSLHGAREELHDTLVARPGSFRLARAGLANAALAGLEIWVNLVFTRANLDQGPPLAQLIHDDHAHVRGIILSVLQPHGLARTTGKSMVPKLADAARAMDETMARCDLLRVPYHLSLCENPVCFVLKAVGDERPEEELLAIIRAALSRNGCTICGLRSAMCQDKVKPPSCGGCVFEPICDGVWQAQVALHGAGEVRPRLGRTTDEGEA